MPERVPLAMIFDLNWDETSFVDEGDNPGARILFRKRKGEALLSDEEIIEKAIAEVAGDNESEEPMTELVEKVRNARTQEDVVAAMNEEADRIQKQDPTISRSDALWRVYETHNLVLERTYELPAGEVVIETQEPVQKSAGEIGIMEAARELMAADPTLQEHEAVAKVFESPRHAETVQKWRREH